ncbi:hypothetical protein DL765_006205 [Monosporascus sp. GIB2]|nr:hypothetical protein DL765_006205 [Monosporascus sp. GIB2]
MNAPDDTKYCRTDAATRDLLFQAASSGIVLLKNDHNALPLKPGSVKKLAIVGPNAKRVVAGGGGSSYINAPYWTSVFESTEREFKDTGTKIVFHTGAKVNRYLPAPTANMIRSPWIGRRGPEPETQLDPMEGKFQGIRFGYEEHDLFDLPSEAAQLAQGCDAAIVVVGRDKEWETEGQDIPFFELPEIRRA